MRSIVLLALLALVAVPHSVAREEGAKVDSGEFLEFVRERSVRLDSLDWYVTDRTCFAFLDEAAWFLRQLRKINAKLPPGEPRLKWFGYALSFRPGGGYADVAEILAPHAKNPLVITVKERIPRVQPSVRPFRSPHSEVERLLAEVHPILMLPLGSGDPREAWLEEERVFSHSGAPARTRLSQQADCLFLSPKRTSPAGGWTPKMPS